MLPLWRPPTLRPIECLRGLLITSHSTTKFYVVLGWDDEILQQKSQTLQEKNCLWYALHVSHLKAKYSCVFYDFNESTHVENFAQFFVNSLISSQFAFCSQQLHSLFFPNHGSSSIFKIQQQRGCFICEISKKKKEFILKIRHVDRNFEEDNPPTLYRPLQEIFLYKKINILW